ncbi:hypothetical protein [Sphingosinicella terrae]|uniref:hypothetical protein n=1 Tax=Sphingosinicella terrae TaxID=2172047 RepID=UPI000E0DD11C|nr:hypothetical protein [Sphingosinicella terrae]
MTMKAALKFVPIALAGLAAATAAPAQVFLYEPAFQSGPIEASDPLVGVALPGATANEYRAHLLWNLRSGLNVAALQCQFSPYLRTVDNYNGILAHHSQELANAYQALEGYFRRVHGRTGPRRFDDYSTQTYNNFSTLQAQFGFCQVAGRIGKEALGARKGELNQIATARMRELRSSLSPMTEAYSFVRAPIQLTPISLFTDCRQLRGRDRRNCEREQRR